MFGPVDWSQNGSPAEYAAVDTSTLAPPPADVDHMVAAALAVSGLTAWKGLIDHARATMGQTLLIPDAAGGVGSIAVQVAREVGAVVIGTDRETALGLGTSAFLDLDDDKLEDAGPVDVVFDVICGETLDPSTALVRAGGTLVNIARMPTVQPQDGRAMFLVVAPDRFRLADLALRLRDGRLKPIVGTVCSPAETPDAFARVRRTPGKTVIRIVDGR